VHDGLSRFGRDVVGECNRLASWSTARTPASPPPWPCWRRPASRRSSRMATSLADFGTEILRLAEAVGPGHVAIGTDLDGNYRPVLTSYDQLDDLVGLLRDRGLPPDRVRQILGGNAMELLGRVL
jgi:microsomal dipeptidase-like Zn-dependent dipeptidase